MVVLIIVRNGLVTRCVEYETVWMLRVRKMKVQMGGNVVIRLRVAAGVWVSRWNCEGAGVSAGKR